MRPQPRHAARRPIPRHNLAIVFAVFFALGILWAHWTSVNGPGVVTYAIFAVAVAALILTWRKS